MPIDTINWIKIYIYKEIQFINRIIKGTYSKAYMYTRMFGLHPQSSKVKFESPIPQFFFPYLMLNY